MPLEIRGNPLAFNPLALESGEDPTRAAEESSSLIRTTREKTRELTDRGMSQSDVLRMIKRRARDAGLPTSIGSHTCRATGITDYLANGGTLETAANIAGHTSPRTTQLYNRNPERISLAEIERIRISGNSEGDTGPWWCPNSVLPRSPSR